MDYVRMSEDMRERVNAIIRYGEVRAKDLTREYVDQGQKLESLGDRMLFACYTPYGVACIEAAFLDRMRIAEPWDSKDLIRKDILTNPHLHLSIKERLLDAYEKANWASWHDSYFCKRILGTKLDAPTNTLRDEIEKCPYLTPEMRANLLLNVSLAQETP